MFFDLQLPDIGQALKIVRVVCNYFHIYTRVVSIPMLNAFLDV